MTDRQQSLSNKGPVAPFGYGTLKSLGKIEMSKRVDGSKETDDQARISPSMEHD